MQELNVYCQNQIEIKGLSGWVFEQTVQYYLIEEFKALSFFPEIKEQVKLGSRALVDLMIFNKFLDKCVMMEIKSSGIFSKVDMERYKQYRQFAFNKKCSYIYITGSETSKNYKDTTISVFGVDNAFFLDDGSRNNWQSFVDRLMCLLT